LTVFSQIGTVNTIKPLDTSKISFPRFIAVRMAQDLVRYDSVKAENIFLKKNIELYKSNLQIKDTVIASKNQEITILTQKQSFNEQTIAIKDGQILDFRTVNKDLTKELKKRTVQRDILGGTAIALIVIEIGRAVIKK